MHSIPIQGVYSLSTHDGVEEEEGEVGLFLGLREALQWDEILLLPFEELGVHVGAVGCEW